MMKLKITLDPKMELHTALQLVAGDPNINQNGRNSYYQDMFSYFKSFQNHPAVAYYQLINNYFCFDAPINSMLFMELEDELSLAYKLTEYLILRAGSKQNWMDFYAGLKDFSQVTGFKRFLENHSDYYQQAIAKVNAINGTCVPPTELESYLGMEEDKYTLRFSPLQTCGYAGCNVRQIEGVSCTKGL